MRFETIHFEFTPEDPRLDSFLAACLPDISRARIQDWIRQGYVTDKEGGQALKASFRPKNPVTVQVCKPLLQPFEPPKAEHRPDALHIVFEDEHLLVIDKPVGLTVHPGAGQHDGTLVNLLLGHTDGRLSSVGTHERPGIVHRLDKDTSGLMVVAKTNHAHVRLAESLQKRDMKRIYQAIVHHVPQPLEGSVHTLIGRDPHHRQRMAVVTENGKEAITHYRTLQAFMMMMALVECHLDTGRTHQIRVHMASIGCPVVGDPLYAGRHDRSKKTWPADVRDYVENSGAQLLHACRLAFPHPETGAIMEFESDLPERMTTLAEILGRHCP